MNGRSDAANTESDTLRSFDDLDLKLGDLMRGERATMGKSLLDVQRDIKIRATYLAAIEDADLSAFESPGFIAGYVRTYARYLGMDPDWVYKRFRTESGFSHLAGLDAQIQAGPARAPGLVTTRPSGRGAASSDEILARSPIHAATRSDGFFSNIQIGAIGSFMVLAALVGGLAYGGWSVLQEIQKVTMAPVETRMSALPDRDAVGPAPLDDAMLTSAPPSAEALERLYRPKALDRPVLVARDGPIAILDPNRQGVYASYTTASGLPLAVPPPDGMQTAIGAALRDALGEPVEPGEVTVVEAPPPKVMLLARRPVWVRVRAEDGSILLEKILEEGEHYVLPESEAPPTLRAGNSGSLFFAVNGETRGPAGPGTSVAKNVVLSADALVEKYAVADLDGDPELARIAALAIDPEPAPPAATALSPVAE